MIGSALRAAVRGYQWFLRPLVAPACRFHPSCSEYADEALARYGAWRGGWPDVNGRSIFEPPFTLSGDVAAAVQLNEA